MDIAFHYFAIKSLARTAGFTNEDAQCIAKYSQFVDDYNWYFYRRFSNIPPYAKAPELDLFINNWYNPMNFNPATTGFSDVVDFATLVLPRSQKFTVSPFHFIPQDPAHVKNGDYRTYPSTRNDNSYISNMLTTARNNFLTAKKEDHNLCLMHIGLLLHIFADTYAHHLFTGYQGWENKVTLTQVTNNITGNDESTKYGTSIAQWIASLKKIAPGVIPAIGHMLIAHVPDLTHLTFTMKYQTTQNSPESTYTRSNTQTFETAGREILNYLRSCLKLTDINETDWNTISQKLTKAFLIDISNLSNESAIVETLTQHWTKSFPNCTYTYASDEIKQGLQRRGKATDDFYRYNVFADQLLIQLYGKQPRN
ncbi:MAG: hypothetical protein FWD52_03120 [Candidatus Bathyarchaeota archaeon]|nr:hypothetical protein [Candidatus Termiticorpusculum sp.]